MTIWYPYNPKIIAIIQHFLLKRWKNFHVQNVKIAVDKNEIKINTLRKNALNANLTFSSGKSGPFTCF